MLRIHLESAQPRPAPVRRVGWCALGSQPTFRDTKPTIGIQAVETDADDAAGLEDQGVMSSRQRLGVDARPIGPSEERDVARLAGEAVRRDDVIAGEQEHVVGLQGRRTPAHPLGREIDGHERRALALRFMRVALAGFVEIDDAVLVAHVLHFEVIGSRKNRASESTPMVSPLQ